VSVKEFSKSVGIRERCGQKLVFTFLWPMVHYRCSHKAGWLNGLVYLNAAGCACAAEKYIVMVHSLQLNA